MDYDKGMELMTINPADPISDYTGQVLGDLRQAIGRAVDAWLLRTPPLIIEHRQRPLRFACARRSASPSPGRSSPTIPAVGRGKPGPGRTSAAARQSIFQQAKML
jgi:hypothetical protein